jgi:hypothetical protein
MLFDVQAALAKIRSESGDDATRATSATPPLENSLQVADVAHVARPAAPEGASVSHMSQMSHVAPGKAASPASSRAGAGEPRMAGTLTPDPAAVLALLRYRGPMTYGAVSSTLGWGATRAWRVETELRQGGRIRLGPFGRAFIIEQTE